MRNAVADAKHMSRAYLSLGSNIKPEQHLRAAIDALHAQFGDLLISGVYRTEAVGFDGPAFLNMVVGLDTEWTPQALDQWLHALEDSQGRRRDVERYSSRTLDIDIILFGDLVVDGPGHLQIPRDELKHAFVLAPLAEIAPHAAHPLSGKSMQALWQTHPEHGQPMHIVDLPASPQSASTGEPGWILYQRDDCQLCDEALAILAQAGVPDFTSIWIDDDADLESRYGQRIPVLRDAPGGRELDWPFNVDDVRACLERGL